MKYLFLQIFIVFLCVTVLSFFFTQEHFLPINELKVLNWYNITSVLFFLFLLIQAILSIAILLIQKLLKFGLKGFPTYHFSLKWGITSALLLTFIILFNIFHVVDFLWGGIMGGLILLILILLKY